MKREGEGFESYIWEKRNEESGWKGEGKERERKKKVKENGKKRHVGSVPGYSAPRAIIPTVRTPTTPPPPPRPF